MTFRHTSFFPTFVQTKEEARVPETSPTFRQLWPPLICGGDFAEATEYEGTSKRLPAITNRDRIRRSFTVGP